MEKSSFSFCGWFSVHEMKLSLITTRKVSLQVLWELIPCGKLAMERLVPYKQQHHNRLILVLWRGQAQWKEQYALMWTGACWVLQTLQAMVDSYEIIMVSSYTGFTGWLQSQVLFFAKLMVVLHGLTVCWENRYKRINCLSDSLQVVNLIRSGVSPHHRFANEIFSIRQLRPRD
jgi:hypothetical protein